MAKPRQVAPPARHVALLIETSKSYGRSLLHGISQYVKEHGPWSLFFEPRDLFTSVPPWLKTWRGDGIIARLSNPAIARAVLRTRLPVVNLSSALPDLDVPRIEANTHTLGQMALRHLLERGFRRFAFLGDDVNFPLWSHRVQDGFARAVSDAGYPCDLFTLPRAHLLSWEREQEALARWIGALAKPVGVFVVNDSRGQRLLDACRRAEVQVPDQVAVLGNENDELVCTMASPPLSSLIPNAEKMGYEAAAMLDRMMAGGARPKGVVSFETLGAATRQSTDVQAHEDPIVGDAVRFIRENAGVGIKVKQVLDHVGVSRSNLDQRFTATLGRTPHDEIVRVQLQRAMELLSQTTLKTLAVAEKAGFRHLEYMGVVFRKKLGLTPGEYRKRVGQRIGGLSTLPLLPDRA